MKRLVLACFVMGISVSASAEEAIKLQVKATGGVTMSMDGAMMHVNYEEPVPIVDLIKVMAQASGKNVILDKDVGDEKVAVSFDEPLPKADAYQRLVEALESQGLRVQDEGKVVRISR